MTMVIGMFDSLVNAQRAVSDLVTSGYAKDAISMIVRNMARDDEDADHVHIAGVLAGGPLGATLRASGPSSVERAVTQALSSAGLRPAAATLFADAICNGGILVAVHCADTGVREVRDILDIYTVPEPVPEWRERARASS